MAGSERPFLVRKFNSVLHACTVGLIQKTTKAAYNVSKSALLWCVVKLLDTSRLLERVTGVERRQTNEKPNKRKPKQNGSTPNGPETQLSRPLNQIIEDTFKEEFARLTATSSGQNQKAKRKKSKKSGSKGETSIKTTDTNSNGHEVGSNFESTINDKESSKDNLNKDKSLKINKDLTSSAHLDLNKDNLNTDVNLSKDNLNKDKILRKDNLNKDKNNKADKKLSKDNKNQKSDKGNNKDSSKDNQDFSSDDKKSGKAVSKDNKNSSQDPNFKLVSDLNKGNKKIIEDNRDLNKGNKDSSKNSSILSTDSSILNKDKTLNKDNQVKDNNILNKDKSLNKDNKHSNKDSNILNKDSNKDIKDSSKIHQVLNKDNTVLSKDSQDNKNSNKVQVLKVLSKDNPILNKDSSILNKDSSILNKDSSNLSKDKGLNKDNKHSNKANILSKDNKDSNQSKTILSKVLIEDSKAVSKDNKSSSKNVDSIKIVNVKSFKEDLSFAKSTEVKSRDSKVDLITNLNVKDKSVDVKVSLKKAWSLKNGGEVTKPNLKPVDENLRFNKSPDVTVNLSKNNLESANVNKKTLESVNCNNKTSKEDLSSIETTIKTKELVLNPKVNGNSKGDLRFNNKNDLTSNLNFAQVKTSDIKVTSELKDTNVIKVASNIEATSATAVTTQVKRDTEATTDIKVTSDKKVVSDKKVTITSKVDVETVETSIQTKHREIVNTLEEILHQSNELCSNILGKAGDMKFPEGKIDANSQVRVLTLNHKEHHDSTLYRLEKEWVIQFRLGPSLMGRKVYLFCNYPADGERFKRVKYNRLTWLQDEGCNNADDTALYAFINVKVAGSFHYYFTYDNLFDSEHQGSGFFIVDPVLYCGTNETLPLDCVQCQTVLAKSLGRFDTWERKLRVSKESGYNMIHFTPLQELGESKSSYCLKDQRKLNPSFNGRKNVTFNDVEKLIAKMRDEWKVTSICDIVLNHTANESPWLLEHPEATYNCENCTYMRPAYLLDAALHQFSIDVRDGLYENQGIPTEISTEGHLNAIRYALHNSVLNKLKLQELYICDVCKLVAEFSLLARTKVPRLDNTEFNLKIQQDLEFKRLKSTVNMEEALQMFNVYRNDCFDEETRIKRCVEDFKAKLDALNQEIIDKLRDDLNVAVENCIAGIRYFRVQEDGPKLKKITHKHPLVYRNFTDYNRPETLEEHESTMYGANSKYLMAHNGWVMDADPLHNFASDSKVYLRRELIAWGDSVKLRYGDKPEDSPFLWQHMRKYVEETARIFDGVRLDNCHSTPIPVAEYLLDCARNVRPDLYVVAELFTNSDQKDNIFVNRLGITSLIREAMSAWDSHEQGRLVYRYGGDPVGAFYQPNVRPLVPSVAHALFLDLTHDNPSPIEKRSVFDLLPSTALVNMACCASGSNRGYDELVPHHIHVVDESREYTEWNSKESEDASFVSLSTGIVKAKKALNDLHFYLGNNGFKQVYVDQVDTDIVAVTRHNPETHESVILVAFTAFKHPESNETNHQRYIKPLRIEGELQEIIMEASLRHRIGSKYDKIDNFKQDSEFINGYSDYELEMRTHMALEKSQMVVKGNSGDCNVLQLNFEDFKPGSVIAFKVCVTKKLRESIKQLRALINNFTNRDNNELVDVINRLTLADLNRALYRCDPEERDDGLGFGAYEIPNFGAMVYCGLQGVMSLLVNVRPNNDLGHPLCANLRNGNWLIEYISNRLKAHDGTHDLGRWIEENTAELKKIPTYIIPAYFDVIITGIYILLIEQCYSLMSEFVSSGSTFVRSLALGSVQFGAVIKSSPLPMLAPNLAQPRPKIIEEKDGRKYPDCVSLSAGLPHFTTGFARNWGRDTFIALRGLFILTGRREDARYHILGYAACLRHGLIPNLLDGGNARYNCRDAVWWWLYSIKCYVEEVPGGEAILYDKVSRLYPKDDSPLQEAGSNEQVLHSVMQEALRVHFQGLSFRERNAGEKIDEHMSDRGFNVQIGVHPETGFTFGGNESNCGTWMDKMGSSNKANNRGKPATPRDGSSIEIVALSKSVLSWLAKLSEKQYPYLGVERKHRNGSLTKWSFSEWADKIHANFEKCFWINTKPVKGELRPDLINKRGIYKDCYGASQDWSDYQMRCNFPIAMVIAPELFNADHAWTALEMAEKHLLGPLGMKTLDSSDWNYCGDYDVSNDSNDYKLAHGFNYHQGPEWVWPIGYFLRARLLFAPRMGQLKQTIASTKEILSAHFVELQTSPWRGIPELTNTNGAYCEASSRTQAWSMSSILEVLHDLQRIESKEPININ